MTSLRRLNRLLAAASPKLLSHLLYGRTSHICSTAGYPTAGQLSERHGNQWVSTGLRNASAPSGGILHDVDEDPKGRIINTARLTTTSKASTGCDVPDSVDSGDENGRWNPEDIVRSLDEYIIGQDDAKRSLAIALRDRWRRQQIRDDELRKEITPNNILLTGPSGCGKTELARRLSVMASAPFVKVAVTRFTEVGFVGDDTSSIIHMLAQQALADEQRKERKKVLFSAQEKALKIIVGLVREQHLQSDSADTVEVMLREGRLDDLEVEVDENLLHADSPRDPFGSLVASLGKAFGKPGHSGPSSPGLSRSGSVSFPLGSNSAVVGVSLPGFGGQRDMKQRRKLPVKKAMTALTEHLTNQMVDTDDIRQAARAAAESKGIVFLDEFDKLVEEKADRSSAFRSKNIGVQRELLTLIEGTVVPTQLGNIATDHILFIASGSFLAAKPSDIVPELQGRLPVRCTLKNLTREDFVRILRDTKYNLLVQQKELLATEGVRLEFTECGVREMAKMAEVLNIGTVNVGARRLRTVLAKILEDIKFEAPKLAGKSITIDKNVVQTRLQPLHKSSDLSQYIL